MKKILTLLLVGGATASLSACGGIPTCNDVLDECDRGGAYTEERTVEAGNRRVVKAQPAPAPTPAPAPAPVKKIQPAPAPVIRQPAPVVDTQIMRSAEPEFRQISK